jgi:hypothetical protein
MSNAAQILQDVAQRYGVAVHSEASFYRARPGESSFCDLVYDETTRKLIPIEKAPDGLTHARRQVSISIANRRRADRLAKAEPDQVERRNAAKAKVERQKQILETLRNFAASGMLRDEIALRMGMTPSSLVALARHHKIKVQRPVKPKRAAKVKPPGKRAIYISTVKELAEPLLRQGMSITDIAVELKSTRKLIRRFRDELDIVRPPKPKPERPKVDHKAIKAAKRADQLARFKEMHAAGMTVVEIKVALSIGTLTLQRLRDEAGVVFKRRLPLGQHDMIMARREKVRELHAKGLAMTTVAQELGVPITTVHRDATAMGLEKGWSRLRVGRKPKRDEDLMRKMKAMREKGLTIAVIAQRVSMGKSHVHRLLSEMNV